MIQYVKAEGDKVNPTLKLTVNNAILDTRARVSIITKPTREKWEKLGEWDYN